MTGLEELLSQKVVSLPPQRAPINAVDRDLDRMWEALRVGWTDAEAVTRACMSNLLIYCSDHTRAMAVRADLPAILQEHPARVLLLWEQDLQQGDVEATVSVHFSRLGRGLQVWGEEVGVACGANADQRLPAVARSLLVGDLPTSLWWVSEKPPSIGDRLFEGLARLAEQIIFDSVGWPNPPKAIMTMARWIVGDRAEHVIYNLAWRRLKPWRKMVSETLDASIYPTALSHVIQLELEHGPHALPVTWLLIGWLANRLGWQPKDGKLLSKSAVKWHFDAPHGIVEVHVIRRSIGDPLLYRMDWVWQGDCPGHVSFQAEGDRKIIVCTNDALCEPRSLSSQRTDRARMVAEQLAHRDRDRLFEEALAVSNAMATVLLR